MYKDKVHPEKSREALKWGVRIHVLWYVIANVAQVLVWWLATPEQFFWPLWSIAGWGIGLAAHILAVRSVSRHLAEP